MADILRLSWGGGYWRCLGCPAARLSSFPEQVSETNGGFLSYCKLTSLRGVDMPFGGLGTLAYLNGRPSPIINFDMPDIYQTMPDS